MAIVRNYAKYSVDLTSGRLLAPNATANVDTSLEHEAALIAAGDLVIEDPSVDPPPPDEPLLNVPRRVFVGNTQPVELANGDLWVDKAAGALREDVDGTLQVIPLAGDVVVAATGSDDSALVQAALDACAYVRRVIFVGDFEIDVTVSVPSGTDAEWAPGAKFTAKSTLTGPILRNAGYAGEVDSVGNHDITLRSPNLDGNKASGRSGANTHTLLFRGSNTDPCRRCWIFDAHAYNSPLLGLVFQNVQDSGFVCAHVHDNERDGITCYWNCQRIWNIAPHVHDCKDDLLGFNAEVGSGTGHTMTDIHVVDCDLHDQSSQGAGIAVRGVKRFEGTGTISKAFSAGLLIGSHNTTPSDRISFRGAIVDAGANNSGGAGHAVMVVCNDANSNVAGTAPVTNVDVDALIQNPRAHGYYFAGVSGGELKKFRLRGTVECGSLYTGAHGLVSGVDASAGYCEDHDIDLDVRNAQQAGVRYTGTANKRITVSGGKYLDSGQAPGATSPYGLSFANVETLHISPSVHAYDTRAVGSKTQAYGLRIVTPTGALGIQGVDFVGDQAPAATTVNGAGQAASGAPYTLTVASTASFPSAGTMTVAGITGLVAYTGKTGTTFTGCTGGSGTATDGGTITQVGQQGNATAATTITGTASCTSLKIRENTGWSPFSGRVLLSTWTSTTAGGQTFYQATGAVTYELPLPTGQVANVIVQPENLNGSWGGSLNNSNTGFTARGNTYRNDFGQGQYATWLALTP